MPKYLHAFLVRLRSKFVSPLVVAICDSLKHDGECWSESCIYPFDPIVLMHSSQRFGVQDWGHFYGVSLVKSSGETIIQGNKLECFLLRRAVKVWRAHHSVRGLLRAILST